MQRSFYTVISKNAYRAPDGGLYRFIYATRTATAAAFPSTVLDALEAGDPQSIDVESLDQLRDILAVDDEGVDELGAVLDHQRARSRDYRERNFTLLPTSYCNMGCEYCGQLHRKGGLPRNHRDSIAERVVSAIEDPATESLFVNWFGAEPLVGYPVIRELSQKFTAKCAELGKAYRAAMVTNGSLLTHEKAVALHREDRVVQFEITLDGPKRIHDVHRPMKNGKGSFDHIITVLRECLADPQLADLNFTIRTNVDVNNVDWVPEYIEEIHGHGLAQPNVAFYFAPVYPWGNDVSAVEIDRREFSHRQVEWYTTMNELGIGITLLPEHVTGSVCIATNRGNEVISSTGNVFSCSEHPLVPQYEATAGIAKLGTLQLPIRPVGQFDDWHDSIEAGESDCRGCKMLPVCGGACPKQWRDGNVACPPFKYTVQERFDLMARFNGFTVEAKEAV
ncbi:uncharacterized protein FB566_2893 [Stackebrandtia endophytica]|uniref:Radical SAM core domain-containing protein n=1 Tax=Stackebrandtia endophytica TaxID=1496996 RepID=A0A543AXM8_9ACTN|nr:radical SAM protein [Stackebrandtia endophytica]TQL77334.1 uncharacterized protein FB566_2893 [Stackebrandtia endophytica]